VCGIDGRRLDSLPRNMEVRGLSEYGLDIVMSLGFVHEEGAAKKRGGGKDTWIHGCKASCGLLVIIFLVTLEVPNMIIGIFVE